MSSQTLGHLVAVPQDDVARRLVIAVRWSSLAVWTCEYLVSAEVGVELAAIPAPTGLAGVIFGHIQDDDTSQRLPGLGVQQLLEGIMAPAEHLPRGLVIEDTLPAGLGVLVNSHLRGLKVWEKYHVVVGAE